MSKIEVPQMQSCPTYTHWKKMIIKWCKITKVTKKNQADTIILTLPMTAQNLALQIPEEDIEEDDGVKKLLEKLDEVYDKNTNQKIWTAYEEFEQFRRGPSTGIAKFLGEFDSKVSELKALDINLPESLLAFRLLKAADLNDDKRTIVRATCKEMTLKDMKTAILNVFEAKFDFGNEQSSSSGIDSFATPVAIKEEPVFYSKSNVQGSNRGNGSYKMRGQNRMDFLGSGSQKSRGFQPGEQDDAQNDSNDRKNRYGQKSSFKDQSVRYQTGSGRVNRIDRNTGRPSTCRICNSIYHFANQCPTMQEVLKEKRSSERKNSNEVFETHEVNFNNLVAEEDHDTL